MDLIHDALRLEEQAADAALVPARIALGAVEAYHGFQKLKPQAIEQLAGGFEQMGLRPGKPLVVATGVAELVAGATSILGIGTRIGALAALVTQSVAVAKVHGPKGFETSKGGFEFNFALIAIAAGLLIAGPGDLSARGVIRRRMERRRFADLLLRRRKRSLLGRLALAI